MSAYVLAQPQSPDRMVIEGSLPKARFGENTKTLSPDEAREYLLKEILPQASQGPVDPAQVEVPRVDTVTDFALDMAKIGDVLDGLAEAHVRDQRGNVRRTNHQHPEEARLTSVERRRGNMAATAYDKAYESRRRDLEHPLRVEVTHRRTRLKRFGITSLLELDNERAAAVHADGVEWAGFTSEVLRRGDFYDRIHAYALEEGWPPSRRARLFDYAVALMRGRPHGLARNTEAGARRDYARMKLVPTSTLTPFVLDFAEGRVTFGSPLGQTSHHRLRLWSVAAHDHEIDALLHAG